jgi:hypothetical protein
LTDQTPDDIFALFSRFELDGDHYRVFHRETPSTSAASALLPTTGAQATANHPATLAMEELAATPEPPLTRRQAPLSEPSSSILRPGRPPSAPSMSLPELDETTSSLQSLWRHVSSYGSVSGHATADALAADSISVTGFAGGVGATTISATLARMLAKSGRRCGLFDDTDDPSLPIFFGTLSPAEEQHRFVGLRSIVQMRARIVRREMFEAEEFASAPINFITRNWVTLSQEFDNLVFDRPTRSVDCSGAGIKIVVAVPDLSSLARAQKAQHNVESRSAASSTVCVLNRFNSCIPLHAEILGWYRDNFPNLIVVRESALVAEALAEGSTVVDWMPDAPIADDFRELFATVRQSLSARSERLPVCS